jgi:hypothetical protein
MRYSPRYKRFYDDRYWWSNHDYKPSKRHNVWCNRTWAKMNADPYTLMHRRVQMLRKLERAQDEVCESGYTRGQGWGGLARAWTGFIIAKRNNDTDLMERYALTIHRIERDLSIPLYEFRELKFAALEYMQDEENRDLLQEKARQLHKEVDELSSNDILDVMLEQDQKAYELLNKDSS